MIAVEKWGQLLWVLFVLILLPGCTTLPRSPVPIDKMAQAEVLGISGIRAWGGQPTPSFQADIVESVHQEPAGQFPRDADGKPLYAALALSGGGSHGAFGAGVLCGWTQAGNRPTFKMVTGISTGSLIAPFAFLGPQYDEQLKGLYTTIKTVDILEKLNFLKIFRSESFAKTTPLQNLLERNIDEALLKAIVVAHNRGRRLYIGTTHMDAQRLVVWNMGLIAKSGHPEALSLFRQVLLASASIPGAFPPVMLKVEVDGKRFDEMHTDGGTTTQVFFHGGTLDVLAAGQAAGFGDKIKNRGGIYIIRNGQLSPQPEQVRRNLSTITTRAIDTMIKNTARNDLFRIYAYTLREKIDFHYVDI
ncbi:MAG: patatin-like phospholipase family protein, partial [Desulfofustis sp.]